MKSCFILITSLLFLIGCKEHPKEKNEPTLEELIQGDWVSQYRGNYPFGPLTTFADDYCTINSSMKWTDSSKFQITDSLLFVFDNSERNLLGESQEYKILQLTNAELILLVNNDDLKTRLVNEWNFHHDTLVFTKMKFRNSINPIKIDFASSVCLGSCPRMKFTIDKSDDIIYWGGYQSAHEGWNNGGIGEKEINRLLKIIQILPLQELDSTYSAPYTCGQLRCLSLTTEDTVYQYSVYGTFLEPPELTLLLDELMYLDRKINLTPIQRPSDFEFHHFEELYSFENPSISLE